MGAMSNHDDDDQNDTESPVWRELHRQAVEFAELRQAVRIYEDMLKGNDNSFLIMKEEMRLLRAEIMKIQRDRLLIITAIIISAGSQLWQVVSPLLK